MEVGNCEDRERVCVCVKSFLPCPFLKSQIKQILKSETVLSKWLCTCLVFKWTCFSDLEMFEVSILNMFTFLSPIHFLDCKKTCSCYSTMLICSAWLITTGLFKFALQLSARHCSVTVDKWLKQGSLLSG